MPAKNKDEIAFCGLRCGDYCIQGKGVVKENAKQILEEIEAVSLDVWQESLPKKDPFNYDDLKKGLKWLSTFDCKGCHAGGGDPDCPIRKCAKKKGFNNCGECPDLPCDITEGMEGNFGKD